MNVAAPDPHKQRFDDQNRYDRLRTALLTSHDSPDPIRTGMPSISMPAAQPRPTVASRAALFTVSSLQAEACPSNGIWMAAGT